MTSIAHDNFVANLSTSNRIATQQFPPLKCIKIHMNFKLASYYLLILNNHQMLSPQSYDHKNVSNLHARQVLKKS